MHEWASDIVLLWLVIAIAALAIRAATVDAIADRAMAVSLLSLFTAAALVVIGVDRGEPGYVDGALALALLSFGQTAAVARFVTAQRRMP